MARRRVCFIARRIKKVPVKVTFRTKEGVKVSFKATKAIKKPTRVCFYVKGKKRK